MVRELVTVTEFDELLASCDKLIVVDFTATWCGPCQKIAPVFNTLSQEFPDVVFVKVDVDKNNDTAEKCKVTSMPTFHFYKDNTLKHQFSGASEDKLRKAITDNK